MLDLYVENLRQKKLDKRDKKLLKITGLQEIVDLYEARDLYNKKVLRGRKYFSRKQEERQNLEMVTAGVDLDDLTEIMD